MENTIDFKDLKSMFINSNGEMLIRVKLTDDNGLRLLHSWLTGKIDPLAGVSCSELIFHDFSVDQEADMLKAQIVDQVADAITTRLRQIGTITAFADKNERQG